MILSVLPVIALSLVGCASTGEYPRSTPWPNAPAGEFVTIESECLHVRAYGDSDRNVVLLHGMGDSSIGWSRLGPALAERGWSMIAWDALGAGQSEKPADADYSLEAHCERLRVLLDARGVERAVLIGHSLGGSTALLFAQQHPQRVDALVLINPAAYRAGAPSSRWLWEARGIAWVGERLPRGALVDWAMRANFREPARIGDNLLAAYLTEARRPGAVRAFIAQAAAAIPEDASAWEAGHASIDCPVLVLWGTEDAILDRAAAEPLKRELADVRWMDIGGAGHSPHLERPSAVETLIAEFLRQVESRKETQAERSPQRDCHMEPPS